MASVVLLIMGGGAARGDEIQALRDVGHDVSVVEPRFPDCKPELEAARADIILVDGEGAPSHGRATAAWMAGLGKFRTVPVVFLDAGDRDVPRAKKEIPRAQFSVWASVAQTTERLAKKR